MNNDLTEFVKWTHLHSPLLCMVKDTATKYHGCFWILDSNDNVNGKYLTVEELYEFYKSNPDWVENVYLKRIGQ